MSGCGEVGGKGQATAHNQRKRKTYGQRFGKPAVFVSLIVFAVAASTMIVTVKQDEEFHTRSGRIRRQVKNSGTKHNPCDFSEEAVRVGLPAFLDRIKWSYVESFPFITLYRSELTANQMRQMYRPYVPHPRKLKAISDASLALADELKKLKLNKKLLKIRERRMMALAKHFLENYFGSPYKDNYYTGSWMSGPGSKCTEDGIAYVRLQVATIFILFPPANNQVLEQIFYSLQQTGQGVKQYIRNIQRGIKTGMINSKEDCLAGLKCLQQLYYGFGEKKDGATIMNWFRPDSYVFNMTNFLKFLIAKPQQVREWRQRYNKTYAESMRRVLVEYVGKPLDDLIYYLKNEHILYCIPKGVINGLGSRPVKWVYYNGTRTNQTTLRHLNTGEIMYGQAAYGQVLSYFTTLPYSPDEVNDMGWKMTRQLYSKAVEIAKNITGIPDTDQAVKKFKELINRPEMFLNEEPFPANESNTRAHKMCSNQRDAQKYCPVRYAAMQRWFKVAQDSMSYIEPNVESLFYRSGTKKTTPSCPIDVAMSLEPDDGVQSYMASGPFCDSPSKYIIPFFVDRMGPKYLEWSVSAHEGLPGHHLQMQGYFENFRDNCPSSVDLLTDQQFTAFAEGWGMYAENPLAYLDMNLFKNHSFQWYGIIKTQLWRALRLVIDTGLHCRDMSHNEAVKLFHEYIWETGDVPQKEVKRYRSWAGQAATYMTGQLALWNMRKHAQNRLGSKFSVRDFHYQILRHGQVPMDFLREHIEMYVDCVLDNTKSGCVEILGETQPLPKQTKIKLKTRDLRRMKILKLKKFLQHKKERRFPF